MYSVLGKEIRGNIDHNTSFGETALFLRSDPVVARNGRIGGGGEIHFLLSLGLEGANNSSLVFQGCSLPHPIVSGDFRVESSMEGETRRVASVANRKIYFGAQLL